VDVLWLLGADEFDVNAIGPDTFVIYQGHHGDRGAARADVILPSAAYVEKHGTYVNTEGRVQIARPAVAPPGEAREDWRILRAFSDMIDKRLPYDTIEQVRARMVEINQVFGQDFARRAGADQSGPAGEAFALGDAPLVAILGDYYQTNAISRASPTMAQCSAVILKQAAE